MQHVRGNVERVLPGNPGAHHDTDTVGFWQTPSASQPVTSWRRAAPGLAEWETDTSVRSDSDQGEPATDDGFAQRTSRTRRAARGHPCARMWRHDRWRLRRAPARRPRRRRGRPSNRPKATRCATGARTPVTIRSPIAARRRPTSRPGRGRSSSPAIADGSPAAAAADVVIRTDPTSPTDAELAPAERTTRASSSSTSRRSVARDRSPARPAATSWPSPRAGCCRSSRRTRRTDR